MFGRKTLNLAYWAVAGLLLTAATILLFTWTPVEATMGPIQKIFYVHPPLAINTFLAALAVFVASVGYIWQRNTRWDDLAGAAAKVAVVYCFGVLATGMIWGHSAWGQWWTWSPRLTFSLMLWLLYVVYLLVRSSIESPQRRATVSAIYGITAFLDVPLVWLSARMMPDIRPSHVELDGAMKLTLALWFVPVTLIAIGLIGAGFRRNGALRERGKRAPEPTARPARLPLLAARGGRV